MRREESTVTARRETLPRLWNANYCKVMTANFSLFFAFYLLMPVFPLYLSEFFGAGKDTIGLVLSGYTLTALLVRPFSGFIVDSFPRKRVLLVCFTLYFIVFGGYLLASTLLLFAIVRTLHGAPFGALTVANSTVAIDVLPSERRREGVGYYGLSNNLATAIAPTVGLLLYHSTANINLLFWLSLLTAGFGLVVSSTVHLRPRTQLPPPRTLSLDRFFLVRGWLLALNIVLFGLCYGVLSNFLAIYAKEVMGITGRTGLFFTLLSLGLILSRVSGVRTLRDHLVRNAAIGVCVSTVGYLLFVSLQNEAGFYISALLIGLGNGHFWPAFQNMMLGMASANERGTANSTLLISWDIGIGLGILMGGLLTEHVGYAPAFWIVAAIHAAGAAFFLATKRVDS